MAAKTLENEQYSPAVVAAVEQLSCPGGGGFGAVSEAIAVAWAERQLQMFLLDEGPALKERCPDLAEFLEGSIGHLGFGAAWAPALGDVLFARRRPGAGPVDVATAWGLHLTATRETPATWSGRLSSASPILFAGRVVGSGDDVVVESDGDQIRLTVSSGPAPSVVVRHRRGDRWLAPDEPPDAAPVPVTAAHDLPPEFLDGIESETATAVDPPMIDSLVRGNDCLRAAGRGYDLWVRQIVRQVLALRAEDGRIRSGSRSDFPGFVHLSLPEEPRATAESLVHESSHQYYHLALRLGRPVTADEDRLYYSPAVGRPRPLDRLLLAYHAFANVAVMYHAMLQAGVLPRAQCEHEIDRLRPMLAQLREPLVDHPAVTALGRAIVDPVDRQILGLGILPGAAS